MVLLKIKVLEKVGVKVFTHTFQNLLHSFLSLGSGNFFRYLAGFHIRDFTGVIQQFIEVKHGKYLSFKSPFCGNLGH